MSDDCFQRPSKRGKLLPEKRLFQELSEECNSENQGCPTCEDNQEPWRSTFLNLSIRRSRARLLQQRHPPPLNLAQLPDDLLFRITNYLDAPSLLQMRCLNRRYRWLCGRNQAGWDCLCRKLWETKVHIPDSALRLSYADSVSNDLMMKAYQESIHDARERQLINLNELFDDPVTMQGTVWSFRFKESAGSDWTLMDPWYNGLPCRKMVFLPDGSIKQYILGNATLESPRFGTTSRAAAAGIDNIPPLAEEDNGLRDDDDNHNHNNNNNNVGDHLVVYPAMTMAWRFLTRPMDLPTRPLGSYVRISVGGRDVPTYSIRRSPTGNWGFVMESCWGLFASFGLPSRLPQRPVPTTMQGNVWLDFLVHDDDDHGHYDGLEEDRVLHRHNDILNHSTLEIKQEDNDPMLPLRDDTYMLITNEIQSREAFLYNGGARILPGGDEATDEFDRAWGDFRA
jgi:hypothetical protein